MKPKSIHIRTENAQDLFTDREEPRAAFWDIYNNILPGEIETLHFYGVGGIGKTTLLKKIADEVVEKDSNQNVVIYCFDKDQSKENFLFALSRQIMQRCKKAEFPLFDYAFSCMLKQAGCTEIEIENHLKSNNGAFLTPQSLISPLANLLPVGGGAVEAVSNTLYDKIVERIKEKKKHSGEDANYVYKIEMSTNDELIKDMHKYFAHDVLEYFEGLEKPFVIMLDGYEFLVNYLKQGELSFLADDWLCGNDGLVCMLPNVIWVVAGREMLTWDDEILSKERKHLLGNLSELDALGYFEKAGIAEEGLRNGLYELTAGVPVYMDLCCDIYTRLKMDGGVVILDDFGKDTRDLAKRFYQNMEPMQQKAFSFLCCLPHSWTDKEVFSICEFEDSDVDYSFCLHSSLDTLKKLSLIEKVDNSFKIHEITRNIVVENVNSNIRSGIINAVMTYYHKEIDNKEINKREKGIVILDMLNYIVLMTEYVELPYEEWEWLFDNSCMLIDFGIFEQLINAFDRLIITLKDDKERLLFERAKARVYYGALDYNKSYELNMAVYEKSIRLLGERHINTLKAKHNISACLSNLGRYEESYVMRKKLYAEKRMILGENHKSTLLTLGDLSVSCYRTGRIEEAVEVTEKAYTCYVKEYGVDNSGAIFKKAQMASAYRYAGEYQKENKLRNEIYKNRIENDGEFDSRTIEALQNLGCSYLRLGDSATALEMIRTALDRKKEIFGETHPKVFGAMSDLARCYVEMGMYSEAITEYLRVIELKKEVYGYDSQVTMLTRVDLAYSLIQNHEYGKAKDLCEENLKVLEERLEDNNPLILQVKHDLSSSYRGLGDYDKALEYGVEAYEGRKKVLGEYHPETLKSLNNIANDYMKLDQIDKAIDIAEKVVALKKKALGEKHPSTLLSMNNLCLYFRLSGRNEDSIKMLLSLIDIEERVHGNRHPITIKSYALLASSYKENGEYDKSRELFEKVYSLRREILGESHPDTLSTLEDLNRIREVCKDI